MKHIVAFIFSLIAVNAAAAPFADGAAAAGKKLFDDNKCNRCHIGKVGGDGSTIFTRPTRIVHNPQQLIDRMIYCSGAVGMTLTPQNEQDLGAYLNQTYYKFK
jgi:mono/diheme cytochrome c family protein